MPVSMIILILLVLIAAPAIIILIFHSGIPRPTETPSKTHLKKDEILEARITAGRWRCPSCNDTNLEIKDDCGSCGQRVKKIP